MAITVTATGSAGTGVYLLVKVLTGATEAGGKTGVTAPSTSVTPNFTNSLILFASVFEAAATLFTAAASNTFYDNATDGTNGSSYCHGFYSGAVTSGTPVTVGATAPTGGEFATYEVPPVGGSTPVVDGSSPALVTSLTTATIVTAGFTPPVGSVLAAMVGIYLGAGTPTVAVSCPGLVFTQRVAASASGNGLAAVWTATVPASGLILPQPGGRVWRRRHRRGQTAVRPPPGFEGWGVPL